MTYRLRIQIFNDLFNSAQLNHQFHLVIADKVQLKLLEVG